MDRVENAHERHAPASCLQRRHDDSALTTAATSRSPYQEPSLSEASQRRQYDCSNDTRLSGHCGSCCSSADVSRRAGESSSPRSYHDNSCSPTDFSISNGATRTSPYKRRYSSDSDTDKTAAAVSAAAATQHMQHTTTGVRRPDNRSPIIITPEQSSAARDVDCSHLAIKQEPHSRRLFTCKSVDDATYRYGTGSSPHREQYSPIHSPPLNDLQIKRHKFVRQFVCSHKY